MFNDSKNSVVKTFDRAAKEFDTIGTPFFSHYGKVLVDMAIIKSTDCVLDIACGKGATTFPIAEKISEPGRVYGIDISSKMIEECKRLAIEKRLEKRVAFSVMDAENLEFENESIDTVICGFGLFFLPDIERGLQEIRRVLKRDGLLIFSSWNREYQLKWLYELIVKYVPAKPPEKASGGVKILDSDFTTIAGLEKILACSGFKKELIRAENLDCFYCTEDEWLETYWHTAFRMFFERMSEDEYKRFKAEVLENIQRYKIDGKFKIIRSAYMTRARKEK